MTTARIRLGALGEKLAAEHLANLGFEIIDRNVRYPEGELDIVAARNTRTVFVEVKTRRGNAMGTPEDAITPAKRRHLIQAGQRYLQEHPERGDDWRIDVVAVAFSASGVLQRIDHYPSAVEG